MQDKARKCFWQLLQALHMLHENNIVHHDVKLENILLQKSNDLDVVKLVDFGLSHVMDFHGLHDWFVGSRAFGVKSPRCAKYVHRFYVSFEEKTWYRTGWLEVQYVHLLLLVLCLILETIFCSTFSQVRGHVPVHAPRAHQAPVQQKGYHVRPPGAEPRDGHVERGGVSFQAAERAEPLRRGGALADSGQHRQGEQLRHGPPDLGGGVRHLQGPRQQDSGACNIFKRFA